MTPSRNRIVYGAEWTPDVPDLGIELACIQRGGRWVYNGKECGKGLFYHYRRAQELCWVEDDNHRWSDLSLSTILKERITVIMGSRDSGKTDSISKFALIDYWAFPNDTLILMSSTDIRGLELRVWGHIKNLFQRARERYPFLSGNASESKHGIFTDTLDDFTDIRDIRKGIICIPCLGSDGQWAGGLEKFVGIKQKRRRLLGDECFPPGTIVDTASGPVPIEHIQPGDYVVSATGIGKVIVKSTRWVDSLLTVKTKDGRTVHCTPNHPFLTDKGWTKASELTQQHYLYGYYEAMQVLRSGDRPSNFLQCLLYGEVYDAHKRGTVKDLYSGTQSQDKPTGASTDAVSGQPNAQSRNEKKGQPNPEGEWTSPCDSWREWHWHDQGRASVNADNYGRCVELRHKDGQMEWQRHPPGLQSGRCYSRFEIGPRSRWRFSQFSSETGKGYEEGFLSSGSWVDSVEVYEPPNSGLPLTSPSDGRHRVHNLQIEGHPSYSVNGFIVHNCQFMHVNYLTTLSNLDKGDFKGGFVGNPIGGNGKALDKIAEPEKGWSSLGEVTKTTTWRNRFGGITINLVGTDSPNFDKDRPKRYSYLIDQSDVDRVAKRSGRDSAEFISQILGVRKIGVDQYRVLTRSVCLQHHAYDPAIWSGEPTTKVLGIDAGYGGDTCETIVLEFGPAPGGRIIIKFSPTVAIPILIGDKHPTPEDQIAAEVKLQADALGIPGSNIFVECGMRATLGISMAKIISNEITPINAGGPVTDRPVSNDLFVLDPITYRRRLMMCSERYVKFITEMWYSVREAVESDQVREIPESVVDQFAMREWEPAPGNKYQLETKDKCKARMGESPNKADAAAIALEGARRLGFMIERIPSKELAQQNADDWLARELDKERNLRKRYELTYG